MLEPQLYRGTGSFLTQQQPEIPEDASIDVEESRGDYARIKVLELLLVKGWANRDVAAFLDVSEQQVANYRFAAVKKLTEQIRDAGLPADVFPELRR